MIKILPNLGGILIISTLLIGCGFAPHSTKSFPIQLRKIHYQTPSPYEPFAIYLKKRLKRSGIIPLPLSTKSIPIVHVNPNYNYSTNNSSSSTQARIYTLNYSTVIKITNIHQNTILKPQTVTVTRNVVLQPNEVFEVTPQVTITKKEMIRELANKTLNILSAPKTAEALQKFK